MRAMRTRMSRNASRTQRRKYAAMPNSTGTAAIENTASRQSIANIAARMNSRRTASPSRLTIPDANISDSDSTSFVSRVISRPTGVRSKNDVASDITWRWTRTRRSFIPSWPITCVK